MKKAHISNIWMQTFTALKVSKYAVSCIFRIPAEYSGNLRIYPDFEERQARKISVSGQFLRTEFLWVGNDPKLVG